MQTILSNLVIMVKFATSNYANSILKIVKRELILINLKIKPKSLKMKFGEFGISCKFSTTFWLCYVMKKYERKYTKR